MNQWMSKIHDFHECIWSKAVGGGTIESNREGKNFITLDIDLDSFRIFGFLDDTGFRTTAPGIGALGLTWTFKDHSTLVIFLCTV